MGKDLNNTVERRTLIMAEKNKKSNSKTTPTETIYLQFRGKEVLLSTIREAVMQDYNNVKEGKDEPEDIRIYLKPEDNKAYYVINEDYAGEVLINFE